MKMRLTTFFLFVLANSFCQADLTKYLKSDFGYAAKNDAIKNIDAIYLINLDQRTQKLEKSLEQLEPYNIIPYRFSAIYGWDLPLETFIDLGVKYAPGMHKGKWVSHYSLENGYSPQQELLQEEFYGKTCFTHYLIQPGAMGCALSHLSILQNAFDCGYETIWVMEDDISVQEDPHKLTDYIEKLDAIVGKNGWDILYTDMDTMDHGYYEADNDFISDLKGMRYFFRPDMSLYDQSQLAKRTILNEDFLKIGYRPRTHSMLIRRSGMKKILDFKHKQNMFHAYDGELALIPDIKLINLRKKIVTVSQAISDTIPAQIDPFWEYFKHATLKELSKISGWQNPEVAAKLMDLIHYKKLETCVEIGAFAGAISYPIGQSLYFQKKGAFYPIDVWDKKAALEGLESQTDINSYQDFDFEAIHQNFKNLLHQTNLERYCHPIAKRSRDAVTSFANNSIDLLFIDGNASSKGSLEDVTLYLPKVKEGGYIWLNGADAPNKSKAVAYLMNHCRWVKDESIENRCLLFQKEKNPPKKTKQTPKKRRSLVSKHKNMRSK